MGSGSCDHGAVDTRLLEYFVAVADEGGVLHAADQLMTSASTVSSGLHSLERELGTPLFSKVGRRLRLTAAGEDLLPVARRALDAVEVLQEHGDTAGEGLTGRVRLGVFPGMEDQFGLPEVLAGFIAEHPGVEVRTAAPIRGSTGAIEAVGRGSLDVAFCAVPVATAGVEVVGLGEFPYRAFLPAAHRLAREERVDVADLGRERWVDVLPGYGNRRQLDAYLEEQGLHRRVTAEVATLPSVAIFVAAGLGMAVIPQVVPDRGCVVRPLVQDVPPWRMSLLPMLIVWRIAAMAGGTDVTGTDGTVAWQITGSRPWALMVVCGIVTVLYVIEFAQAWHNDVSHRTTGTWIVNLVWGATLVRIWFGFNEIGHATEKIFAGHDSWAHMTDQVFGPMGQSAVAPFSLLGQAPGFFVVLAGIIELSVGLGIGFGFMTRLAGAGGVAYLLLATLFYGGEWLNGYGWAGGGWEYPMLLIVFFISFVFTGAGPFSIDLDLRSRGALPGWMRRISITRSTDEAFAAASTK